MPSLRPFDPRLLSPPSRETTLQTLSAQRPTYETRRYLSRIDTTGKQMFTRDITEKKSTRWKPSRALKRARARASYDLMRYRRSRNEARWRYARSKYSHIPSDLKLWRICFKNVF